MRFFFNHRDDAVRNSPMEFANAMKGVAKNSEIVVAVAQYDSNEFRRQSQEYYQVHYLIYRISYTY